MIYRGPESKTLRKRRKRFAKQYWAADMKKQLELYRARKLEEKTRAYVIGDINAWE